MSRHDEDYGLYQISERDRDVIRPKQVTHLLYVSVFINGSRKSTSLQTLRVSSVCVKGLFVHLCRSWSVCVWDRL